MGLLGASLGVVVEIQILKTTNHKLAIPCSPSRSDFLARTIAPPPPLMHFSRLVAINVLNDGVEALNNTCAHRGQPNPSPQRVGHRNGENPPPSRGGTWTCRHIGMHLVGPHGLQIGAGWGLGVQDPEKVTHANHRLPV